MSHSRFTNLFSPFYKRESEDRTTHNHTTDEQTQKAGNITRVLRFFFCPQAVQQPLSHFCSLTSGWTDGQEEGRRESELRLQIQRWRERHRRRGWSQWGRKTQLLLLSMVDSHNKWRGARFHTESIRKRESRPKGRWKHRDGGRAGAPHMWQADLHKYTPHAHARSHQSTQLTQTPSRPKCLWLQQRLQILERNKISQLDWKRGRLKKWKGVT